MIDGHPPRSPLGAEDGVYSAGDPVELTLVGGYPDPGVDRYLFTVASRGLRQVRLSPAPSS